MVWYWLLEAVRLCLRHRPFMTGVLRVLQYALLLLELVEDLAAAVPLLLRLLCLLGLLLLQFDSSLIALLLL